MRNNLVEAVWCSCVVDPLDFDCRLLLLVLDRSDDLPSLLVAFDLFRAVGLEEWKNGCIMLQLLYPFGNPA